MKQHLNFMEAESLALNMAYKSFYGDGQPIGMAFTYITDRKAGNAWSESEKAVANYISNMAIRDLKNINLAAIIHAGLVPDCVMVRRFMATGSGQTASGHNY